VAVDCAARRGDGAAGRWGDADLEAVTASPEGEFQNPALSAATAT